MCPGPSAAFQSSRRASRRRRLLSPSGRLPGGAWSAAGTSLALHSLVTALLKKLLSRIDFLGVGRRIPKFDVIESSHDQDVATQLSILTNRRGQGESTLLVELDVRGVCCPVAPLLALARSTRTALFETLIGLASELARRPKSNTPFGVRTGITAPLELGGHPRPQAQ